MYIEKISFLSYSFSGKKPCSGMPLSRIFVICVRDTVTGTDMDRDTIRDTGRERTLTGSGQ
jgi:hypothetical protein